MAIRLTERNYYDLLEQAKQQEGIFHATEIGWQRKIPSRFGEGYTHHHDLRGGLAIDIFNRQLWQPIIRKKHHQETFPIVSTFYLSGGARVKTDNVPEIAADYEEVAGCNYLYHLPDLAESEAYPSDTPIQMVRFYTNADYFQSLNPKDDGLLHQLQQLMQADKRFHQSLGKTTSAMNQVLQQILHCPYQGVTQQLYIESKVLELLALQFACLEADASVSSKPRLNAADLERVNYARDILVSRLSNPPSIRELARICKLNDFKLKQGFRQLFGNTVFGYLYDYRMQYAQQLLRDDRLSVAAISAQVGYRSSAAFSVAFRRKFVVGPKAYQLSQRSKA